MARRKQMAAIPEVTIEKVLGAFLDAQRAHLKPRTFGDYEAATDLLEKGWTISCALVRRRGRWHLAEVANVYP